MKPVNAKIIFALLFVCFVFTSCHVSITKRKYNPGFYVDISSSKNQFIKSTETRTQKINIKNTGELVEPGISIHPAVVERTNFEASLSVSGDNNFHRQHRQRFHSDKLISKTDNPILNEIFKNISDSISKPTSIETNDVEKIKRTAKTAHILSIVGLCSLILGLWLVSIPCAIIAKKMTAKILSSSLIDTDEFKKIKRRAIRDNRRAKATLYILLILLALIIVFTILAFFWALFVILGVLRGIH